MIDRRALVAAGFLLLVSTSPTQAQDRYDPTIDPNVQAYLVCVQLASGAGGNSNLPDASAFDQSGYVQWNDGTGKVILCQNVVKS